ncbi:MAG: zinc ribbon domain-containing protein [Chloroflexi bacterium]|nr:zinc ribbon domain-containing protein [Chloroflexota bacterium]
MPIYEFKCADCGRLSSVFVKTMSASYKASCQHCGGKKLERALSRFAYHKSEQTVLEEYGSEPQRLEDYKDPRQIGRWAERKFDEFGVEMPKEAREMIDAAREGEFPEPVKDL